MSLTFYTKVLEKLDQDLADLSRKEYNIFQHAEHAVSCCAIAYRKLQNYILSNGFRKDEDEIYFFKHIKPRVYSKILYYKCLAEIESEKPKSRKGQKAYLRKELGKIYFFFQEHTNFVRYYRSGQTLYDDKYFIRRIDAPVVGSQDVEFLINPEFSTAYDSVLSRMLAYEDLEKFLDKELHKLKGMRFIGRAPNKRNTWTANLPALAELIYGLKAVGAINNGNITVRELTDLFGQILSLPQGDIYNAYRTVYTRKSNQVIFIDRMREAVLHAIDRKYR